MGKDAERPEILRGTLDLMILKTLQRGEMHGYGIAEAIRSVSGDILRVEEGSLYPALQRLLLEGWISVQEGRSDNNRKARFYKLTAEGRKRLSRELSQFDRLMEAVFRVLRTS